MDAVLIVALLGGFVATLGGILLVSHQSTRLPSFAFQAVQGHPIPFRRRAILFSKAERSFYRALRALVPDHLIFVKVKLGDLISLKPSHSLWEHFSPINRKQIDFVVCDPTLAPVVAIKLDNLSRGAPIDILESVLATASVPLVHVPQQPRYLFNELRRLLAPYLIVPRPLL